MNHFVKTCAATLFAFGIVFSTGCATTSGHSHGATAEASTGCESCKKGKAGEAVWCDHCGHGYVDGKKTGCKGCFKGKSGGTAWCNGCKHGYVAGVKVACKVCFDHKTAGGPACEKCAAAPAAEGPEEKPTAPPATDETAVEPGA